MSALLFVIGMEHLSRILKASRRSSIFIFHPKCKKLGFNHLIFADDLMLMRKGDSTLIQVLIESINLFSKASGLHENSNKSAMFLAGLSNKLKMAMAEDLQFPLSNIPVKYLGVPLSSKRITAVEWDVLVDKITEKIKTWYAKYLTNAARLQLVNAVFMSISSY